MRNAIGLALIASLGACSHAQPVPEPVAAKAEPAPAAPAPVATPAKVVEAPPPIAVPAESIYFDFDRSELKPEGTQFLEKLGAVLASHPELKVRIEGNCDERGTGEYNIALGQRRADAAKRYLVRIGAREEQILAVSYGETRPRAQGHDEDAWRENRRDDFIPDRATVSPLPVSLNR